MRAFSSADRRIVAEAQRAVRQLLELGQFELVRIFARDALIAGRRHRRTVGGGRGTSDAGDNCGGKKLYWTQTYHVVPPLPAGMRACTTSARRVDPMSRLRHFHDGWQTDMCPRPPAARAAWTPGCAPVLVPAGAHAGFAAAAATREAPRRVLPARTAKAPRTGGRAAGVGQRRRRHDRAAPLLSVPGHGAPARCRSVEDAVRRPQPCQPGRRCRRRACCRPGRRRHRDLRSERAWQSPARCC